MSSSHSNESSQDATLDSALGFSEYRSPSPDIWASNIVSRDDDHPEPARRSRQPTTDRSQRRRRRRSSSPDINSGAFVQQYVRGSYALMYHRRGRERKRHCQGRAWNGDSEDSDMDTSSTAAEDGELGQLEPHQREETDESVGSQSSSEPFSASTSDCTEEASSEQDLPGACAHELAQESHPVEAHPECGICMENNSTHTQPERLATLPCEGQHKFHASCLHKWFQSSLQQLKPQHRHPTCPLCRSKLTHICGCDLSWRSLVQDGITVLPAEIHQPCGSLRKNRQCRRPLQKEHEKIGLAENYFGGGSVRFNSRLGRSVRLSQADLAAVIEGSFPSEEAKLYPAAYEEVKWLLSPETREEVREMLCGIVIDYCEYQNKYTACVELDQGAKKMRGVERELLRMKMGYAWGTLLQGLVVQRGIAQWNGEDGEDGKNGEYVLVD